MRWKCLEKRFKSWGNLTVPLKMLLPPWNFTSMPEMNGKRSSWNKSTSVIKHQLYITNTPQIIIQAILQKQSIQFNHTQLHLLLHNTIIVSTLITIDHWTFMGMSLVWCRFKYIASTKRMGWGWVEFTIMQMNKLTCTLKYLYEIPGKLKNAIKL